MMKAFGFDPKSFSKREIFIGGVDTYVYNDSLLIPYIENFNAQAESTIEGGHNLKELPINVLYLVHQRGGDYTLTESIAYKTLKEYYEKKEDARIPLICVTFDNRNHGSRNVNESSNKSWKGGNKTHGVDMISMIKGNVDDLKLIIDFLPSYLNLEPHVSPSAKKFDTKIKYNNILSGYSLGGHTVIRFANLYPHLVSIINPVVGCCSLSTLLLNRLFQYKLEDAEFDKKWFYFNYDELPLTKEQQLEYYPESFHKLISDEDVEIFENFPFHKIKVFASFGKNDTLVPPTLSKLWIDLYTTTNSDSEVFIQEDVGHDVTPEMIDKFTTWLTKQL